jgi:hypothetical protein
MLLLHFKNATTLRNDVFTLTVIRTDNSARREIVFDGRSNTGFIVSVPAEGLYRIEVRGSDGIPWDLDVDGTTIFSVFNGETVIEPRLLAFTTMVELVTTTTGEIGLYVMGGVILLTIVIGVIVYRGNVHVTIESATSDPAEVPAQVYESSSLPFEKSPLIHEEDELEDIRE